MPPSAAAPLPPVPTLPHGKRLLAVVLLAIVYATFGTGTFHLFQTVSILPILWIPDGIALAVMLLNGRWLWPGVLLGSLASMLSSGFAPAEAAGLASVSLFNVLFCYTMLRQFWKIDPALNTLRDFFALLWTSALAALLSALLGSTVLYLNGSLSGDFFSLNLIHWWQGVVLGLVLITPLILSFRTPINSHLPLRWKIECALCLLLAFIFGQVMLGGWYFKPLMSIASDNWIFLFATWAAVSCGRRAVMLILTMFSVQGLIGAFSGRGFYATDLAQTGLMQYWFLLILACAVGASLAILLHERKQKSAEVTRTLQYSEDVLRSLPGIFYLIDLQGRLLNWNPAYNKVVGYTDGELDGISVLELIAEEDRPRIAQSMAEVFTRGEVQTEASLLTRAGQTIPYHFSGRRTVLNGEACIIGMGLDVTDRKQAEDILRQSELKYRQLIENDTTYVTIIDGDGLIRMVNESNAKMFGLAPENLIGKSLRDLDPAHAGHFIERYRKILATGEAMTTEDPFPLRDGIHWFRVHSCPMYDLNGQPDAVQVVAFDITERRQAEDALRRNEALLQFALDGAGDAVWDLDIPAWKTTFSPRWKEMLGYRPDEAVDELEGWMERIHPEDQADVTKTMDAMLDNRISTTSNEVRILCKDGRWKWMLSRGMVADRDEEGRPLRLVGTCTDISLIKEHQHQLEHLAHFDPLTDLPNRVLLAHRLQQAMAQTLRRGQTLAVAYLDLDGFKEVNDLHGHQTGDELLVALARRMKETLREVDTLARIGGDEFVVILTDLDEPQGCMTVLNRLLSASSQPVLLENTSLQVSASIGVTLFPDDGGDADQLVRHADQAMYQAKQSGKNRIHLFDVRHDSAIQAQHESIGNIRRGLAAGEFALYYQPKVNMKTGKLIGVEALIRWLHPERGLIPPADFLPVIENQEASLELGEWVIDTALEQIEKWQNEGLEVPVSVNISVYQLQQENFIARLSDVLAVHPMVDHSLLELEILETGAIDDLTQVIRLMRSCQALGIHFSIDDFGTGYSSLSYLKRLPEAVLKIDQGFVRDMLEDPDDLAIVEGIIGLARIFRREIIAEGVESIEHGELLLQLGCHLAQGYGIARPMPANDLPRWAENWQPDPRWLAWSGITFPNPDTTLVLAEVRHRRWLRGLLQRIEGITQGALPAESPLAAWLHERGEKYRGIFDGFDALVSLLEEMQSLAQEALQALADGHPEKARSMTDRLQGINEALMTSLRPLALAAC